MMLSRASKYAILSTLFLASHSNEDKKISVKVIAESIDVPSPFLAKLLQQLVRGKIISSTKGPNGGFYIDEESQKIKLITIIEVFDGLDFFNRCGLGLKECSEEHPCPLHDDFKIYRERLLNLFSSKSIADMVSKIEVGDAFIQNLSRGLV